MKLEVGMYVRAKGKNNFPGGIAKILKIEEIKAHKWLTLDKALDYSFLTQETNVIKASYDIKDLIEVGDYVNNSVVIEVREQLLVHNMGLIYENNMYIPLQNINIKSVLTKEQFENMKYEVE